VLVLVSILAVFFRASAELIGGFPEAFFEGFRGFGRCSFLGHERFYSEDGIQNGLSV